MQPQHQYHRIERERRFLLDQFPARAHAAQMRRITDWYIEHTRLRLRHQIDYHGLSAFKLTQKIAAPGIGSQQGFLTTIYLSEEEFRIFTGLPAKQLNKSRYSMPPFGIDVFENSLEGLILAEAEFELAPEADALILPSFIVREVTEDIRFTGGRLAHASRPEIRSWLSEYGVTLR